MPKLVHMDWKKFTKAFLGGVILPKINTTFFTTNLMLNNLMLNNFFSKSVFSEETAKNCCGEGNPSGGAQE